MRNTWTLIHRYVGLVMAGFLIVAGLTGALLVWYDELDAAAWPALRAVEAPSPDAQPLSPFELRERVVATIPGVRQTYLQFPEKAGEPVYFPIEDAAGNDELYVDPYTAAELGRREWGDIGQGMRNLMPFLYRLHYTLALGTIGSYTFGVIALLWTIDCFIGAYLTFPRRQPFLRKWAPAWRVEAKRLNYDVHRAGGLWPWAMLFVLAWSSVAFNLHEVYSPVTKVFVDYRDHWKEVPDLAQERLQPVIGIEAAYARGQQLLGAESRRLGFEVERINYFQYREAKGIYRLGARSDRDIRDGGGATQIWFDGDTGALVRTILPSGQYAGNTFTNWLYALHMAQVWGLPFRIFVTLLGLAVTALSVTGVVIWWRKRRSTESQRRRAADRAGARGGSRGPHGAVPGGALPDTPFPSTALHRRS